MSDAFLTPKAGAPQRPSAACGARLLERYGLFVFLRAADRLRRAGLRNFLSARNVQNLLTQAAPLGIVVVGQAFVLLVRGLDLSVASMMATAAVIGTASAPPRTRWYR